MIGFRAALLLAALAAASSARAGDVASAVRSLQQGDPGRAAVELHRLAAGAANEGDRLHAEHLLATALEQMGLRFSSFVHDATVLKAGPSAKDFPEAASRIASLSAAWRDEVLGPALLAQVDPQAFAGLPPLTLSQIRSSLALLELRAGRPDRAAALLSELPVPTPRSRYLQALLVQRKDPGRAVAMFAALARDPGRPEPPELPALARLALARTLYGLGRYREARAEYAAIPRFSRHFGEALFEGAYADFQDGDPGGALGKLYSLRSPQLAQELLPEAENLAALVYLQACLYRQAREALGRFEERELPLREAMRALLDGKPPLAAWLALLEGRPVGGRTLPASVRRQLVANDRVSALREYLFRLDDEVARVRLDPRLREGGLSTGLLDALARHRALLEQVGGAFVRSRVEDLSHLLDVLDHEKELLALQAARGEKGLLEGGGDLRDRLAAQKLDRPAVPAAGHEYWPVDGEVWPDEIGYYRYTLKNACPARAESVNGS